jgi:hypothetical protein
MMPRLHGADRTQTAEQLADRYLTGDTIQGLASTTGRSYGTVRTLLLEAGVKLRPRGSGRRIPTAQEK